MNWFQSTPSARRATLYNNVEYIVRLFQSTPSARRATNPNSIVIKQALCFNPRPPHGGRPGRATGPFEVIWFQSTPSARRATRQTLRPGQRHEVSIHALRTEGDVLTLSQTIDSKGFNPRPPHGGRPYKKVLMFTADEFQSTPSARRATADASTNAAALAVSIHALRTEGDRHVAIVPEAFVVSIHALRTEGDETTAATYHASDGFNPRPPHGGRRRVRPRGCYRRHVSIHALRTEGDVITAAMTLWDVWFQSTPSARRATSSSRKSPPMWTRFQSTPSARRATSLRRR